MKIDWTKLKAAIHHDTKTIRALKAENSRSTARGLKYQATLHHAIAAHARKHIHLAGRFLCNPRWISENYGPFFVKDGMTFEEQERFISKEISKFLLPDAPKEASTTAA